LCDGDAVSVQLLGVAKNANLPDSSAGQIDFADSIGLAFWVRPLFGGSAVPRL
jgi:hypothetical protein